MHISAWFCGRAFFTLLATLSSDLLNDYASESNAISPIPSSLPPPSKESKPFDVLDVGSYNVNGDLKSALVHSDFPDRLPVSYTGIDISAGPNVDIVISANHSFPYPFESESFDAIITTSALEHDIKFWVTFLKMLKVLKPGGFLYISVPHTHNEHRFPVDCWRFFGDAGEALASWGRDNAVNVELVVTAKIPQHSPVIDPLYPKENHDTVMIFRKGSVLLSEASSNNEDSERLTRIKEHFSIFEVVYFKSLENRLNQAAAFQNHGFACMETEIEYDEEKNVYYTVANDCSVTFVDPPATAAAAVDDHHTIVQPN